MAMNMRLIYRILEHPYLYLPPSNPNQFVPERDQLNQLVELEKEAIRSGQHVIADNVAQFYAEHSKDVWSCEDIPNWTPPWQTMFVEFNNPPVWDLGNEILKIPFDSQQGVLVSALQLKEDAKETNTIDDWADFTARLVNADPRDITNRKFCAGFQSAKWVMKYDTWMTQSPKPVNGKPIYMGAWGLLLIGEKGNFIDHLMVGWTLDDTQLNDTGSISSIVRSNIHILGLTISFAHCKNVVKQDTNTEPRQYWFHNNKVPKFTSKTLVIDPMRQVIRKESSEGGVSVCKALHICRGHFANYTKDNPLFGKYTGTFWRPDHIRGRIESGQVTKNYDVKPTS